jgi:hypothetical protein
MYLAGSEQALTSKTDVSLSKNTDDWRWQLKNCVKNLSSRPLLGQKTGRIWVIDTCSKRKKRFYVT